MDGTEDNPQDPEPQEHPQDVPWIEFPPPPPGRPEGASEPGRPPGDWQSFAWDVRSGWTPPEPTPPAPPGPPRRHRALVAAVVAGLVLLTAGIGIGWDLNRSGTGLPSSLSTRAPATPGANAQRPTVNPLTGQLDLPAIAKQVDPAIVDINIVIDDFGKGPTGGKAAGTGMILTPSGQVLTNNHVVAGATSISVTVQGRPGTYSATVIGVDPKDDVALIQIDGISGGLPTVTLSDSSTLQVGQKVAAIGNALGRGGTPSITGGAISALDSSITVTNDYGGTEDLSNLVESSTPVSPGDSGGALVDVNGRVVGMVTAAQRVRQSHPVSPISFAIPMNSAFQIVTQIRAGGGNPNIIMGKAGFLGVGVQDVDPATAAQLGLGVDSGTLVTSVVPGSPADTAGITEGSVITAINGQRIADVNELAPAIYSHKPGERITVTWVNGSGTHTSSVALVAGPAV